MTVWYQCCTFFFQHTHTVGNFHITHSHPYQGSAEQPGHSHTATQFLTIGLLSLFAALVLTAAFAAVALPAAIPLPPLRPPAMVHDRRRPPGSAGTRLISIRFSFLSQFSVRTRPLVSMRVDVFILLKRYLQP